MYDFLSQLFAYNKGSASWNWFRWMKCRLLKCSRLFSAGSLIRSVEQSLASHSDGLDLVCAVCADFWKPFALAYSRLFWITSVSFSNGDEKLNLLGWLVLELLWDSVSKDLGFIYLFDRLLLDGDKTLLQRSEELFPFSPLSVGVVFCGSVWVNCSLHFSPAISEISMLSSINHCMSTTLRNAP